MNRAILAWTSNSSGYVTSARARGVRGILDRVVFVPDATAVPTAAYDVTLKDAQGIDVLSGNGANLSATVAKSIVPCEEMLSGGSSGVAKMAISSSLTLAVSAAGNAKEGKIYLYYR